MRAMPKLIFSDPAEIRTFRKKHYMNQQEFWSRIGITQSGGSRFERDRRIPTNVRLLLHLAYAPDDRADRLTSVLRAWKAPKPTEPKHNQS